ncbi:hypothetical protein FE257_009950 [Aspergillus nanangensis]|uniref:Protein kinase domain-containing protein n=1 Tax=Aspergillus nanangensis TaxID=2582783 RepID=A0AAD4CW37_ASPNN|nr:hypothetical protein FE257_009950 [Aspergillus nanangensis]
MAISIADSSYSPTRSLGLLLDPDVADSPRPKQSMWHRLGFRRWLGREDREGRSPSPADAISPPPHSNPHQQQQQQQKSNSEKPHDNLTRRLSRKVGVGLPRPATFKRQNSERRDNLSPLVPEPRRAVSADRRRTLSAQRTRSRSPLPPVDPRLSAPEVPWRGSDETTVETPPEPNEDSDLRSEWNPFPDVTDVPEEPPIDMVEMELERRWILNLSMHFRDRSEREKFFVTYAESPTRWRRVTISCDYRDAPPDSLEQDLKELRYQRDKCARIYESIRESLPEIQFYDTVTNLKLETREGRLHVHVTEDVNEIIPYPPISSIGHLREPRLVPERHLHFEAHLSGFVYNVRLDGMTYIKKEIPGPDTVDEFLYEINALHALHDNPNVVHVEGIVVDDENEIVKGLLISFAEKGALVDLLYEERGSISWDRRERWARQIVHGLSGIHEAGYVQGDFTLSNIVVDANDDAKIIDINRRGCPVGWEPPEIAAKIESNQRISMYIGVKTDLYQLGMTLWALATEEDEPERQARPLVLTEEMLVPDYYRHIVSICLSLFPQHRLSAKELLNFFPCQILTTEPVLPLMHTRHSSLGVGLHNSALPLYNARVIATPTAFLNSRASPGEASDHQVDNHGQVDNVDVLSLVDASNEIVPLPENDSGGTEARDIIPIEPPVLEMKPGSKPGTPAQKLETPHCLEDHLPLRHTAHTPPCLTSIEHRPLNPCESAEKDIDLDSGIDPRYWKPSGQASEMMPFEVESLPGDLAGVGGHPTCSLKPNAVGHLFPDAARREESSISSATTQSSEPHTTPTPDLDHTLIQDHGWKRPTRSRSVSSLLHSMLPINPALSLLGEKQTENPVDRFSPLALRSALGYPRQLLQGHTPYLSDSHLPINPAFAEKAMTSV